jgi:hypothetical protein
LSAWYETNMNRTPVLITAVVLLNVLLSAPPATAADPPEWQALATLAWGDQPGQIGLSEAREDELQRGPHGIAVSPLGWIAVVDRVGGRARVLDDEGRWVRDVVIPGHPGEAALLPDGRLAVADELDERLVRVLGAGGGRFRTPRWALPPTRLVPIQETAGGWLVQGIDPFQLRLPLAEQDPQPRALDRGVPAHDGEAAVVVYKRGEELFVEFDGEVVVSSTEAWPLDTDMASGAATVLATDGASAVLALEAVSTDAAPIRTRRSVVRVAADGSWGEPLLLPEPGPVVIPDDLAALPDGRVFLLVSGADGCQLVTGQVEGAQR